MTSRRIELARGLRERSGLAERRVWALVRGGRIDGLKFRRQHPIGRHVVDFACDRLKLVLEIDGGLHDREEAALNDHLRQATLQELGWTVLRLRNEVALNEPERIADAVRTHARLILP